MNMRLRQSLKKVFVKIPGLLSWVKWLTARPKIRLRRRELGFQIKRASEVKKIFRRNSFGVNLVGNLGSAKGLGKAARSTRRILEDQKIPCGVEEVLPSEATTRWSRRRKSTPKPSYSITINHVNVHEIQEYLSAKPKSEVRRHYNIGYWYWELSEFPQRWRKSFESFYEIWTGSTFAAAAFSRWSPVPVLTMPPVIDTFRPLALSPSEMVNLGIQPEAFVFLFVFDFFSTATRKNPLAVIRAFKMAFGENENVTLIIKTSNGQATPQELAELKAEASGQFVQIIDALMSDDELSKLMGRSDCYVSLHRAEGFGLTMAEAMAMGKPVIATGYSGNLDFMNEKNSYLVNFHLVEIEKDYGVYRKGMLWAEPDIPDAATKMRYVFDHRDRVHEVGLFAQQDIQKRYGIEAVGPIYRDRLRCIAQ